MNAPHEPAVAAAAQAVTTLADAVGQYLAVYALPINLGGIGGHDEMRPSRLKAWVRIMGDKPFATITPDDVEEGLRQIAAVPNRVYAGKDADGQRVFRKRGTGRRSNATVNRHHIALAGLYSWARKQRLLPRDFVSPTRHVEKLPEPRGRVRYLSDSERERLLMACKASSWPRLLLLALMAITTGGRRGELLGLRWCDVDSERGEAILHDTKNGDRRVLVLLPQVLDELAKFAPADAPTSTALVFRSRLRPSQPFAFKTAWCEAVAEAEIRDFHFHDLRHTFASYSAQHGASLLELADALGHKTLKMVQRYSHLSTDSRRRMVSKVFEGRL
jgi:integrase